jgi:hypothetical protein
MKTAESIRQRASNFNAHKKTPLRRISERGFEEKPGDNLLSRLSAVSSARTGLTAVFGMGTGVAPPLWSPESGLSGEGSEGFGAEHLIQSGLPAEIEDVKMGEGRRDAAKRIPFAGERFTEGLKGHRMKAGKSMG